MSRISFSILNEATGEAVNKEPVSTSKSRVAAFEVFSAKDLKPTVAVLSGNVEVAVLVLTFSVNVTIADGTGLKMFDILVLYLVVSVQALVLVTVLADVTIVLILAADIVDSRVLLDSLILELSSVERNVLSNPAVGTVCFEGRFILVAFVVATVVFAYLLVATLVVFIPLVFAATVVTPCLSTALLGGLVIPLTLINAIVFEVCVVDISRHFSTVHLHSSVSISYTLPSVQFPSSRAVSLFPFPWLSTELFPLRRTKARRVLTS